jgi:hypothetical protein
MSNLISCQISGLDASSDEVRNVRGVRHLSTYWIGRKHTHVFTDSVRSCERVVEMALGSFAELAANPFAK